MAGRRDEQREATRARLLAAAQASLREQGYAATSTVAVQDRAGLSRGALLHHFPTRAALFGALVEHLVAANESAVRDATPRGDAPLPLRAALSVLFDALRRPGALAELELWAAARTDPELRAALRTAERCARTDLHRVVDSLLGGSMTPVQAELTVVLLRGLVVALPLQDAPERSARLLDAWADLLETTDPTSTDGESTA